MKQNNDRKIRSDAKIGNVEKKLNVNFDVRSDMKLGNFLKEHGFDSLNKALERAKKPEQRNKI